MATELVYHYRDSREFDFSQARVYRKTATLLKSNVEIVTGTQEIYTIINGRLETKNTAHIGDRIITGVKGERYILNAENFAATYEEDPADTARYISKNFIYALQPDDNIELTAPWGERQRAVRGGYVAQRLGHLNDIYLIEEDAFHRTYRLETSAVSL
jgi:hypothetical protein